MKVRDKVTKNIISSDCDIVIESWKENPGRFVVLEEELNLETIFEEKEELKSPPKSSKKIRRRN